MLRELRIQNVAVIEEVVVPFEPGLNVLTGETGAGKSILIDALQLVLGARSSDDLLRAGADEAVVEAAFSVTHLPRVQAFLAAEQIETDPGEDLVLRRHLFRDGRSKAYLGGRLTSAATLRGAAELLVDIHGQQTGQALLDPRRHREFLDAYAGVTEPARAYRETYRVWRDLERERDELLGLEQDRDRRIELLDFTRRELEDAKLSEGEEEALGAERTVLANHERLFSAVEDAYSGLVESDDATLDRMGKIAARLHDAAAIDPQLRDCLEAVENASVTLVEAGRTLRDYRARMEFDPDRLEQIESRLHAIGRLKRKYGGTVAEVMAQLERTREELQRLDRSAVRREKIEHEHRQLLDDLRGQAARLSARRREAATALEQGIRAELTELGMPKAAFAVQVAVSDGELGPYGFDAVEFLISPNPGEPLKPLNKVASGGELARVMLAIRTVLAIADQTPTVIFDEVDAGIGGSMGDVVGRKLVASSQGRQVLCVTHLPQIACYGDQHLAVEKRLSRERTHTSVQVLSAEERTAELARMLGPSRTTTARDHAAELLQSSQRFKKRLKKTP